MGRRIICTDVHACFYSFKRLIEDKVRLKQGDTLYFLGDAINKGPYSREVLDFLMSLVASGMDIQLLRGNHEQELLKILDGQGTLDGFIDKGGQTLLTNFQILHPADMPLHYIEFIRRFKYFIELPDFYLVHAGFDFNKSNPFLEGEELLTIRDYSVDMEKTRGRKLIHGHSPTDFDKILKSLDDPLESHFSLDAGCVYRDNPRQSRLIALDIDSWQVYSQANIDESSNYA